MRFSSILGDHTTLNRQTLYAREPSHSPARTTFPRYIPIYSGHGIFTGWKRPPRSRATPSKIVRKNRQLTGSPALHISSVPARQPLPFCAFSHRKKRKKKNRRISSKLSHTCTQGAHSWPDSPARLTSVFRTLPAAAAQLRAGMAGRPIPVTEERDRAIGRAPFENRVPPPLAIAHVYVLFSAE